MAAVHQSQTTSCHGKLIQRSSPECSIIVDDVDEGLFRISTIPNEESERSSVSPEYTTERIKEFQRVAEGRKMEFARLLEEHAQVIRRLKQIQESDAANIPVTHSA